MVALSFELALLAGLTLLVLAGLALHALLRRRAEVMRLVAQVQALGEQLDARDAALQRSAQQRRELLANVSHDLRTPLAAMQGYIELLLLRHGSLEPAEERNYLQTAARQSERLGRLVGDLFDLTRLEANELPLQAEDFAPAELAQDLAQKFTPDARQRGVRLEARCTGAGPAPRVHADLALVARVLESLVENALRHTPGGGTVTIEVTRRNAHGARTLIAVRDTGEGIAAADLPGLFERFDQAARVRGAGGSGRPGLGLAIARRIVRLHGAELAVRSSPGHGTEVSFELPPAERRREEPGAVEPEHERGRTAA